MLAEKKMSVSQGTPGDFYQSVGGEAPLALEQLSGFLGEVSKNQLGRGEYL